MTEKTINSKIRVMLVDDDRLVLATLKHGVMDRGYDVETFDNGGDAVKAYAANPPDIVVLDVRMPLMSGPEAARAMLHAAFRPIVMLSAHDDQPIVREAIELGASGYLVKPIEINQLAPSLEAARARFAEVSALMRDTVSLREAVEQNRVISMAVGIVMERAGQGEAMAFEGLRGLARSRRQPLRDLARELVDAVSTTNTIIARNLPD